MEQEYKDNSHIGKLVENSQKLRDYAKQVQSAKDTATLDQAKLAGLNIYQETLREANRAFMEFTTLAREARARVTQANFEDTKRAAKPVTEIKVDETYIEITPEPKPKKAKKTKAKKTK